MGVVFEIGALSATYTNIYASATLFHLPASTHHSRAQHRIERLFASKPLNNFSDKNKREKVCEVQRVFASSFAFFLCAPTNLFRLTRLPYIFVYSYVRYG